MSIAVETAAAVYRDARARGGYGSSRALVFYLGAQLQARLDRLAKHFPGGTRHAIAVKTCNHPEVLRFIVAQGFDLEAASIEEVMLARAAGAAPERIVFDSPVKTRDEIARCHAQFPDMLVNANSLQELERYPADFRCRVGLRLNPLVANEAPEMLNVSGARSKFGVPVTRRDAIVAAALRHPAICCLHFHIGSGLADFRGNVAAAGRVADIAREINAARAARGIDTRITTLDIGGGIDFAPPADDGTEPIAGFVTALRGIPGVFTDFSLVTEFGVFVHRPCGFVVSDIEYVVEGEPGQPDQLFLHVGADLFLRKVYSSLPIDYPYSVLYADRDAERPTRRYDVAGPLCFAGDVLFRGISLPQVGEADKFFIYATGANTWSLWSRHCSREPPAFVFVS